MAAMEAAVVPICAMHAGTRNYNPTMSTLPTIVPAQSLKIQLGKSSTPIPSRGCSPTSKRAVAERNQAFLEKAWLLRKKVLW